MEQQVIAENGKRESQIANISVRGLLALIALLTVCGMSAFEIEVREPLYTMAGMAVGWYFGQKNKKTPE